MSWPETIWAWWEYDIDHRAINHWSEYHDEDQKEKFDYAEYVRRDPAVLAALPEVQALIEALKQLADESLLVGPQHGFVTVSVQHCDAARAALRAIAEGSNAKAD